MKKAPRLWDGIGDKRVENGDKAPEKGNEKNQPPAGGCGPVARLRAGRALWSFCRTV